MKTPTPAPSHVAQPSALRAAAVLAAVIAIFAALLFAATPYETNQPVTVTVTAPASLSDGSDTFSYQLVDTFTYRIVDHSSRLQRAIG